MFQDNTQALRATTFAVLQTGLEEGKKEEIKVNY